jgi:hypothetical protein
MNNSETQITQNITAGDNMASEIEQRLAQIAAAMEAKASAGTTKRELPDGMACPIDPAERALCEGCQ